MNKMYTNKICFPTLDLDMHHYYEKSYPFQNFEVFKENANYRNFKTFQKSSDTRA